MYLLKNIAEIGSGQNAPQGDKYYENGIYTFIKASNLDDIIVDNNENRASKINDVAISECKLKEYEKNTIIFAKSGLSCVKNRVYLTKEKAFVVNHLCTISKVDSKINPEWLSYFIKAYNVTKLIKDDSYPSISLKDIGNIEIPEVSIEKQRTIVDALNNVIIALKIKNNELLALDELIKSRFIEMFMDKNNKDKYPLKKWVDVVKVKHGKDYKKNIVENGGYPVYGSGGFMGVYADNYLVEENATIIGRKGTIDKPILVKEKFWNVDTAFGIEANKDVLNPIFFYVRSTMYDLKSMSTSTTLPSMTKDTLHGIEIGIPPIELQNEFASFVELIDKSKFIVQQEIKDLQELLDKKMDEYFGQ